MLNAIESISSVGSDLKRYVHSEMFADVNFKVEGKSIPAHRIILR